MSNDRVDVSVESTHNSVEIPIEVFPQNLVSVEIDTFPQNLVEIETDPIYGPTGNGIVKIEKTSTTGLVDTYTIYYTYTDPTTFTVTNGNGIDRIELTSTSGLTDTYTIYYTNGTSITFTVTNGKGITDITKTSTSGLEDTYTITYNDGTSSTFKVVNGTTFTPSVDNDGNISWTNDGGKVNPETKNIRGKGVNPGGTTNQFLVKKSNTDYDTEWKTPNTSTLINNGDGTSPFATQAYVDQYGGKIDKIQKNGVDLPIVNKTVNVPIPTKTSDITNDSGFINRDVNNLTNYMRTSDINSALGNKVDKNNDILGGTHPKITYDSKGLVVGGGPLTESDIPGIHLSKVIDITASALEVNVLDGITASTRELNYTKGTTSNIQNQLNNKVEKNNPITPASKCRITYDSKGLVTGGVDLTQSDIPLIPLSKISDVTASATELNYLDGATSNIQNQLNNKVDKNLLITGGTHTKITYDTKGLVTEGTDLIESDIPNLHLSKVIDVTATAQEVNYLTGTTNNVQSQINEKLNITDVINNITTTTTNQALSANMGKELQDQINNLKQRGRYLSIWNCTTGLAETTPTVNPYTYKAGDYFLVGTVGATNYRPNGATYDKDVPSTTVETGAVVVNDAYYYDGTSWTLLHTEQPTVAFSTLAGSPYDNTNLTTALNAKVTKNNDITGATKCKITYDSKGLVTAGTDLTASDIPNLTLNKITDVTATASELNILDGATLTTTELNYVDGVTSNIQTQLNNKVEKNNAITGATKCKITYDSKGLVTSGSNLIASDIPDISATYYLTSNPSGYQNATQVNTAITSYHDSSKQDKLTAGNNIQINNNTISATDTKYTAGQNIQINNNVISATDTTYTAGNGLELNTNAFDVKQVKTLAPSVTLVGTPTGTNNNYYTNFTGSDYIQPILSNSITVSASDTTEFVLKIKTPTSFTQNACYFSTYNYSTSSGTATTSWNRLAFGNPMTELCFSPLGYQGVFGTSGSMTFSADTVYWLKAVKTVTTVEGTTTYTFSTYASTDSKNWTLIESESRTNAPTTLVYSGFSLGASSNTEPTKSLRDGFIYLDECYIKVNGEYVWNPNSNVTKTPALATSEKFGVVKPDNINITVNDGVISSKDTTYSSGTGLKLDTTSNKFAVVQKDLGTPNYYESVGGATESSLYTFTNLNASSYIKVLTKGIEIRPEDTFEFVYGIGLDTFDDLSGNYGTFTKNGVTTNLYIDKTDRFGSSITVPSLGASNTATLSIYDYLSYDSRIWIKMTGTSSNVTVSYSVDGSDWQTGNTIPRNTTTDIINSLSLGEGDFSVTIYLKYLFKDAYLKINDEYVWLPVDNIYQVTAKATSSLYGLVKPDNSTITVNNGVITANTLNGLTSTISELNVLDGITATTTELNYVDGVTSSIQTQLDGKQASLGFTPLNKAGDTMSGALNMGNNHINGANYVYANWYNIGSNIASSSAGTEFLIKQNGWIYSRTPAQVLSDIGGQASLGYTAENTSNKVTSISSSSTDTQYPSAKCVYDIVGNIEATLQAIRGV